MSMVRFDAIALAPTGPTLTSTVETGRRVAIVGPSRAGKSSLADVIAGKAKAVRGSFESNGSVAFCGEPRPSHRARIANIVRVDATLGVAFRLETLLRETFGDLSVEEQARVELFELFVKAPSIAVIDGQLDLLDPWALASAWTVINRFTAGGGIVFYVTHRPDLVSKADLVIALSHHELRFAGPIDELLRLGPPHRIEISTNNAEGVRAIVAPFEVRVTESGSTMVLECAEGRELAVRLLREGYGDVRFVILREPTLEEALTSLLSGSGSGRN